MRPSPTDRRLSMVLVAGLALVAGTACGAGGEAATAPPFDTTRVPPDTQVVAAVSVSSPNRTQAAVVGDAFAFDASRGDSVFRDAAGGGLRYAVTIDESSGLSATGARIAGVPRVPGVWVATIRALDARGRAATSAFRIVAFARDLPTPVLPVRPFGYSDASAPLPAHFIADGPGGRVIVNDNTPPGNPTTDAGAALGRVLFHDRRLSANDGVSCASCHVQAFGFSDTARLSVGFAGGTTRRHTMPIVNLRFHNPSRMFWDLRAGTLELQALHPIQDPVEMGLDLLALEAKVEAAPWYPPLFAAAFGSDTVTADRIARALAQFMRAIVSGGSRFDSAFAGGGPPDFARVFSAQELEGRDLFNGAGRCALCHVTNAHTIIGPANTGLDVTTIDAGGGHGTFKSPSLMNVAVRGRYMHDGRFDSLDRVVEFYLLGVQPHPELDGRLRDPGGGPQRINFTGAQRAALVAYLRTFTDHTILTAERFSSPFRPAPVSAPDRLVSAPRP